MISLQRFFSRPFVIVSISASVLLACNNGTENQDMKSDTGHNAADSPMHHEAQPAAPVLHAEALLTGTYPDTTVTGKAVFDASQGKVKMTLVITVPAKANKSVAVHIHEHGDCGDNGNMTHGHWNPGKTEHGKWGSAAFHAGDIGNVKLNAKGEGSLTLETDLWSLGGDSTKNIMGRGLIVHGGVDDYKTQPTGNAGSRIGCAVIR